MKGNRETGTIEREDLPERVELLEWKRISDDLDDRGYAVISGLPSPEECTALTALYDHDDLFRKHVVMERHGYGRGAYKYFDYPLPDPVAALRGSLYTRLAPIADRWNDLMGIDVRFPSRPEVVPLREGDAVIFAVRHRPVRGTRGIYRVAMRHGVSRLRSGGRHTLGIIFHDAT